MKAQKRKRCKNCREWFPLFNSLTQVCSPGCAIEWANSNPGKEHIRKALKRDNRARKKALKTLGEWKADVQKVFNKFIRTRDHDKPCISCGLSTPKYVAGQGQWDAGHYLGTGAHPELRYEELNVHKQCVHCNRFNSGKQHEYRQALFVRIGPALLDWLEGPHEPKHYTIDDCKDLIAQYRAKTKELEK